MNYILSVMSLARYRCDSTEVELWRAERDALFVLTDRLTAEHDAVRAERDEVRQSYCSLMEAYRGGNGKVTANKLGWGYLFEEDKPSSRARHRAM